MCPLDVTIDVYFSLLFVDNEILGYNVCKMKSFVLNVDVLRVT